MTHNQKRWLSASVPTGLSLPAAPGFGDCRPLIIERWPQLPPIDRFVIIRLFGRSTDRESIEPCMMLMRQWGLHMRDAMYAMIDADVRECCHKKLAYANRHEK